MQNSLYSNFYGDITVNYGWYVNNENWQREMYLNVSVEPYFSSNKSNETNEFRNGNLSTSVSSRSINRRYFAKKRFLEIDLSINEAFSNSNSFTKNNISTSESWSNDNTLRIFIPVKIGIGRLEEVQDAAKAIYIFDALGKENSTSLEKNNADVVKFAEQIAKLRNERFFDYRLQQIREIEVLDSFLQVSNFVLKTDSRYFTTLNDFWLYGNHTVRKSGSRFAFALFPGYKNYYSLTSSKYKQNRHIFTLNSGFEYNYEKPINLYWQNSLSVVAYGGVSNGKIIESTVMQIESKSLVPSMQVGYSQIFAYYPNTRSSFSFNYGGYYLQLINQANVGTQTISVGGKSIYTFSEVSAFYYFSPKLRVNASYSVNYRWQNSQGQMTYHSSGELVSEGFFVDDLNYTKRLGLNQNFAFSLSYFIF